MPPKKPKIPSHLLKKIKSINPPSPTKPAPVTASDFFEQGIEEEESGDRWIISDLSKTIRFYNKAIQSYSHSIRLDPTSENFDAWFNRSRLQFHCYSTLLGVNVTADLQNVDECSDVLGLSLDDVKREHEGIIRRFNDDERIINWDFYYDYGLILIEVVENGNEFATFEELERACSDGIQLFNKILDLLTKELDVFLVSLNKGEIEEIDPGANGNNDNEDKEYTMIEQVTPSVVFDAALTSLKFVESCFEATENGFQLAHLRSHFSGLLNRIGSVKALLVKKFAPVSENKDGLALTNEAVFEFELVTHAIEGLLVEEFDLLVEHWKRFTCVDGGDASARQLSEADNFQAFRDHYVEETNFAVQWELIAHINKCLKSAQDLIKTDLQLQVNRKSPLISKRVSKSVEILINRADNELRRLQFDGFALSLENADVLRQNIVALLKNGLSLSETNCGLRETVIDRLKREKLRRECIVRLVVFTKENFDEEDLVRNLGRAYYAEEFAEIGEIDAYKTLVHHRLVR